MQQRLRISRLLAVFLSITVLLFAACGGGSPGRAPGDSPHSGSGSEPGPAPVASPGREVEVGGHTLELVPHHAPGVENPLKHLTITASRGSPRQSGLSRLTANFQPGGADWRVEIHSEEPLSRLMLEVRYPAAELTPAGGFGDIPEGGHGLIVADGRGTAGLALFGGQGVKRGRVASLGFTTDSGRSLSLLPLSPEIPQMNPESTAAGVELEWEEKLDADSNNDGVVGFSDITLIIDRFGLQADGPELELTDANRDGVIDFSDITTVIDNFGGGIAGYRLLRRSFDSEPPESADFLNPQGEPSAGTTQVRADPLPDDPDLSIARPSDPPATSRPEYTVLDDSALDGQFAYVLQMVGTPGGRRFSDPGPVETVTAVPPDTTPPEWDGSVGITSHRLLEYGGDGNQANYEVTFGPATDPESDGGPSNPVEYNVYAFPGPPDSLPEDRTPRFSVPSQGPRQLTLDTGETYLLAVLPEDDAGNENPVLPSPATIVTVPEQNAGEATVQGDPQRTGVSPVQTAGPFDTQNPVRLSLPTGGDTFRHWPVRTGGGRLLINTPREIRSYRLPLSSGQSPEWVYQAIEPDGGTPFQAPVTAARGVVVVPTVDQRVVGLDLATGKRKWKYEFQAEFGNSALFIPAGAGPELNTDSVVLATQEGRVLRLDLYTGEELARENVIGGGDQGNFTSPPTLAGLNPALIAIGNRAGEVRWFNASDLSPAGTESAGGNPVIAPLSLFQSPGGDSLLLGGTGGLSGSSGGFLKSLNNGGPVDTRSLSSPLLAAPLGFPEGTGLGEAVAGDLSGTLHRFDLGSMQELGTVDLGGSLQASPLAIQNLGLVALAEDGTVSLLDNAPLDEIWTGSISATGDFLSGLVLYRDEQTTQLISAHTGSELVAVEQLPDTTAPVWNNDAPGLTGVTSPDSGELRVTFGDADDEPPTDGSEAQARGGVFYYVYVDDRTPIRTSQADSNPQPAAGAFPRRYGPFSDTDGAQSITLQGLPNHERIFATVHALDAPAEFGDLANRNTESAVDQATPGWAFEFKRLIGTGEIRRSSFVLDTGSSPPELSGVISTADNGVEFRRITLEPEGSDFSSPERVDDPSETTYLAPVSFAIEDGTETVVYGDDPDPPSGANPPEPFFRFHLYRAERTGTDTWNNNQITSSLAPPPSGREAPLAYSEGAELIGIPDIGSVQQGQPVFDYEALFRSDTADPFGSKEAVDTSNTRGAQLDTAFAPGSAPFDAGKPVMTYYRSLGTCSGCNVNQNGADLWYASRDGSGTWNRSRIAGDAQDDSPSDLGGHPVIDWDSTGRALVAYFVEEQGDTAPPSMGDNLIRLRTSTNGTDWTELGSGIGYVPPHENDGTPRPFQTHFLDLATPGDVPAVAYLNWNRLSAGGNRLDQFDYDVTLAFPGTSPVETIRAARINPSVEVDNSIDLIELGGGDLAIVGPGTRPGPSGPETGIWVLRNTAPLPPPPTD